MKILLSPAKSLNLSSEIDCSIASEPIFQSDILPIAEKLKKLSVKQIEKKFSLSKNLADLNFERYQQLGSNESLSKTRQAIFTFDGEVYTGFDTYSLAKNKFNLAQDKIRILSGLYGILKPFDLIEPYRLEMGSDISIGRKKNLYQYWSDKVTNELKDETIINLASNEYFKVVNQKNISTQVLNIDFLEDDKGTLKNISFFSKKARGLAARFIVDHAIEQMEDIKSFDSERYQFSTKLSSDEKYVFIRKFQPIGKK